MIINKRSVILLIFALVLTINLFKLPSKVIHYLHIPGKFIVYFIIPLLWLLFVWSLFKNRKKKKTYEKIKQENGIDTLDEEVKKDKPKKQHKHGKIFTWLGIDDNTPEDRAHRRDFWIVLMIICLIALPLIYTQWNNYFIDDNVDISDMLVISPTAVIMNSTEECNVEMDKGQVCFVENELSKEDKEFVEKANEAYWDEFLSNQKKVDALDDPSFEKGLWSNLHDCCMGAEGEANISLEYVNDSSDGKLSLKLSSYNHCACVSKQLENIDFNKTYILTFDYKGDNPKYCLWVGGDDNCMPSKSLDTSSLWENEIETLNFTENSIVASLHFYADSSANEPKTNNYDNINIYELVENGFSSTIESSKNTVNINSGRDYFAKIKKDTLNYKIKSNMLIKEFDMKTGYFKEGGNSIIIKQQHKKQFFIYGSLFVVVVLILLFTLFNLIKVSHKQKPQI